jgi:hypothetical protein
MPVVLKTLTTCYKHFIDEEQMTMVKHKKTIIDNRQTAISA